MTQSKPAPIALPNPLRALTNPSWAFPQIARAQVGYGRLFIWLGLEFVILEPMSLTSGIFQIKNSLLGGLSQLWRNYLQFALGPGLAVFFGGILLYYLLRRDKEKRLEIYPAVSVVAHAWLPHVAWVCIGAILVGSGFTHPILPQASYSAAGLTTAQSIIKAALEFGPSVAYFFLAYRCLSRTRAVEDAVPRAPDASFKLVAITSALLIVGAAVQVAHHVSDHWRSVRPVMIEDPLPHFYLTNINNQSSLQLPDLKGKVVLMDFWATWCTPCVISMPYLNKLYTEYKNKGFMLISINTERTNLPAVREFIKNHELDFPVYTESGRLQSKMRINTYPTAILIDAKGVVRKIHVGATSMITLRNDIDDLLAQ